MVALIFNPSTWEAKAGSSLWVPGKKWLQWGPVLHKQGGREGSERGGEKKREKEIKHKRSDLNRLLSTRLIMRGHRPLKSYLLMSFTVYVVISLKEKAVDGNTVSILSQLSKLNLQPSFENGNIQDPSEQNVCAH